jgi:hypothetical protein
MTHLTGDLGATATFTRREYAVLADLGWEDGRACTVWFNHFTAKSRLGRASRVSRYSVGEVKQVGFAGRCFVWDKEQGDDEHGDQRPGVRKPPYVVRVDQHGQITCECMAGACRAPTCRHTDMVLILLDEGVFNEVLQGA